MSNPNNSQDCAPGSRFFNLHRDYWKLVKAYLDGGRYQWSDEYWDQVMKACSDFTRVYNETYARELVLLFLDELERRSKDN